MVTYKYIVQGPLDPKPETVFAHRQCIKFPWSHIVSQSNSYGPCEYCGLNREGE